MQNWGINQKMMQQADLTIYLIKFMLSPGKRNDVL